MQQMALQMISRNPQIRSNPNAQSMIEVIETGDAKRGEQIARNLCNTYGTTPEQIIPTAKRFFGL